MYARPFWINRIRTAWEKVPIVWLAGVRRTGKTTLALSFDKSEALFINCELPDVAEITSDPMLFFRNCERSLVIFDEVHYLPDPSRILKIGADEFPHLRIMATGSSTLAASRKFRDTLTGRKRTIHLTPVLVAELENFGGISLERRLYHGGLPPALLADRKDTGFFREWIESFFARDLQRLFTFRDANKFTALFEYLMRQSGGLLDISGASRNVGISRPTVESHLIAMEATNAIMRVRPFFGSGQKEITRMSKCYGFDTGFVSFCRGWSPLRPDDMGLLWEHMVLDMLLATLQDEPIRYWRDTAGHEVDFIRVRNRGVVDAIECKWSPDHFDPSGLTAFRKHYPQGSNYLICPSISQRHIRRIKNMEIQVTDFDNWQQEISDSEKR